MVPLYGKHTSQHASVGCAKDRIETRRAINKTRSGVVPGFSNSDTVDLTQ